MSDLNTLTSALHGAGMRITPQRVAICELLASSDEHPTAANIYDELKPRFASLSLATVYNTLHQFTEVGLLRQIAVDGSKTYFDTNTTEHHHLFIEDRNELVDIPEDASIWPLVSTWSSWVVPSCATASSTSGTGIETSRVDCIAGLRKRCPLGSSASQSR